MSRMDATRSIQAWELSPAQSLHSDIHGIMDAVDKAVAAWEIRRGFGITESKFVSDTTRKIREDARARKAQAWAVEQATGKHQSLRSGDRGQRAKDARTAERRRKIAAGELTGNQLTAALRKEAELAGPAALRAFDAMQAVRQARIHADNAQKSWERRRVTDIARIQRKSDAEWTLGERMRMAAFYRREAEAQGPAALEKHLAAVAAQRRERKRVSNQK